MKRYLLALDLSTNCTGYAVFDLDTKELIHFGILKPSTKGLSKLKYPLKQLTKMMDLSEKIVSLIDNFKPYAIVIEEITGSKNRLTQKILDGFHLIVVYYIKDLFPFEKLFYHDVTGLSGWRTHLQLKLDDADKESNKESRKLNKQLPRNQQLPIIGPKHLACRYVNREFGLDLNVDLRKTDSDMADAISVGDAFLKFRFTEI